MPLVMKMNSSVPIPFMNSTIAGLMSNINGTSTDAPNMANICWMDSGTSRRGGTLSLSLIHIFNLGIVHTFHDHI